MAQDVALWGVAYTDVPEVRVPKQGGGMAAFHDVSDTTASAADVAQGKLFHAADGTLTTGTASGGGGDVKFGVLRPDAELYRQIAFDQMLVADMGISLPSYSTSTKTLKTAESLVSITLPSETEHDWFVLQRALTIPEYSISTTGTGREEFALSTQCYELINVPSNLFSTVVDPTRKMGTAQKVFTNVGQFTRTLLFSSSGLSWYNYTSYGLVQALQDPTYSSGTISFMSPAINIRGSSSYFSSTYYNALTDCRIQYVIDLYRVPNGTSRYDGWGNTSQVAHIAECLNNGGKLT